MRTGLVLLALVAALLTGGRACAHGQLVAADPAEGAVVAEVPAAAALTFSEPVSPLAFRWFPPRGDPVDGVPAAAGDRVAVPLPAGGGAGTYLLSWRVASADGHPVGGSLTFSVGAPTRAIGPATEGPAWAAAAGRGLLTLALVFGVGGAVFLGLVDRAPPHARRLALGSACAVAPLALVAAGLHGLDLLGAPASALLGSAPWKAALASRFAPMAAADIMAAVVAIAALRRHGRAGVALALLAWSLAAGSFALFGHAATAAPRWLTVPAVALHAAGFLFWIGALPALAERAANPSEDLIRIVRGFSRTALPLVALLVLGGALLAIVQLGEPTRLFTTTYGRLLAAKLLLVLPLLGLALLNRLRLTPALAGGDPTAAPRLRRSIRVEIVLAVAILAVASGFRLTPPPRALSAPAPAELHVHLHGATVMANLTLTPGRPGPNVLILTLPPDRPAPLEVDIAFADPTRGLEPIRLTARRDGGSWRAGPLFLPRGGKWLVTVDLLVSDFDKATLRTDLLVPFP